MTSRLKFLVPAAIFLFLIKNVISSFSEISLSIHSLSILPAIISLSIAVFIYPEAGFIWHLIIRSLGVSISFKRILPVWIISNTSRYLPGSVWQYIGRVELSKRRYGVPRSTVVVSLLYEIIFALLAAVICGSFAFLYIYTEFRSVPILIIFLMIIVLNPKVIKTLFYFISKITNKREKIKFIQLEGSKIINILLLTILNFLLNGISLYFLMIALGIHININFILALTSFYAISWVIGFVSFFSPGGVGVLEFSFATLLAFFIPYSTSSLIALLYRFLLVIVEFMVFGITIYYERHQRLLGKKG